MVSGPKTETARRLAELIRDVPVAMLTTAMSDGTLRSRPMATQRAPFDGELLWFFTDIESGKVHEIQGDVHVNVSYADSASQRFVSISGRAEIVQDRRRADELWHPELQNWFPKGPDDPHLALLRVRVMVAEYWDHASHAMALIGESQAERDIRR